MDERCETCRFFFRDTHEGEVVDEFCRRYPPTVVVKLVAVRELDGYDIVPSADTEYGQFPTVFPNCWCGEYQPDNQTKNSTFQNPPDPA